MDAISETQAAQPETSEQRRLHRIECERETLALGQAQLDCGERHDMSSVATWIDAFDADQDAKLATVSRNLGMILA